MKVKKTIGRIEMIDLPDLSIFKLQAKVDTGAKTSVLHCSDYQIVKQNDKEYIQCSFDFEDTIVGEREVFLLPVKSKKRIKSSFGHSERRYIFSTIIRMFDQEYPIDLSLRDRSKMSYPMLLGKNFIKDKFLVDVSELNLSSK